MLSNTGNLSFYLGIFFILVSFWGVYFIYKILKKGEMEKEKVDKLIELGKWCIISVALVTATSIVNDGFREREQDIKEMEFFNKYTEMVTNTNGLEQTWLLCEFFAAVSSQGDLKDAWNRYLMIIKPRYDEYMQNKAELAEIQKKETLSIPEETRKTELLQKNFELDNQVAQVRVAPVLSSKYTAAVTYEEEAFNSLLEKDIRGAVAAFNKSETVYNGFHNAYDIEQLLLKNPPETDAEWNAIYQKILNEYSWKLPTWAKAKLINQIEQSPK